MKDIPDNQQLRNMLQSEIEWIDTNPDFYTSLDHQKLVITNIKKRYVQKEQEMHDLLINKIVGPTKPKLRK